MERPTGNSPNIITRVLADPVRMYLPSVYWNKARDFFVMNCEIQFPAAAGIVSDTENVQNDADFLVLDIAVTAATAAAGTAEVAYLPYLIAIQDTSSGSNWFGGNSASGAGFTHIQNIAARLSMGTAGAADYAPLPHPRFLPRATSVTVSLNNLSANANRVWVSLRGLKVYDQLRQGA